MIERPTHVEVQRPEPPRYTRELSDNDITNLEKIAILRGMLGEARRIMRDARDNSAPGTIPFQILDRFLGQETP